MKRRSVLGLCSTALLSLAGCLFGSPNATPTERRPTATPTDSTATDTPTATPTPTRTRTPLPDRSVPFPEGAHPEPDRPAQLTLRTAISYVRSFHYRATYNAIWGDDSTGGTLTCQVIGAARRGSVFRVVTRCDSPLNVESAGDTGGGLRVGETYVYFLDNDSLIRRVR